MNLPPIILFLCVGILAGAAIGAFSPGERRLGEQRSGSAVASAEPDIDSQVNSELRLAFPGDEGRLGRVFSALQQPIRLRQRFELAEALRDVTAADLPAMMKYAESLPTASTADLLPALAERWFELDSRAAERWARSSSLEHAVIQAWARADPEGAYRAATTSQERWSERLLSSALDVMYGDDAAAKLAKARALPSSLTRSSALATIIVRLARKDPAAAYAALDHVPAGVYRDNIRSALFDRWADQDPMGAIAKLNELLPTLKAGVLGHPMITRAAQRVAAKDPTLALEWLSGIPAEFRSLPAVATARAWAQTDPLAALEWCMDNGVDPALPEWQERDSWQPAVLGEAMKRAPEETFARLASMAPGAERDRLLECAFMESLWHTPKDQLFKEEGAMAWEFYEQLPEEGQIAKAFLFGEGRAQRGDLKDLGAWADKFPPGQARANALTGAASGAFRSNRAEAETLVSVLAPGADRDAALRGLTEAMGNSAPAEAATRALEISNPIVKQDALDAVVIPWTAKDPEASRAWLEANPAIPGAWKQDWLKSR